jgi:hypothetical protein
LGVSILRIVTRLPERRANCSWRKALAHQVLIEAGAVGARGDPGAATELFLDSSLDQGPLVEVGEYLGDGLGRDLAGDPFHAQFAEHSHTATAFDVQRRSRERARHSAVVERSALDQLRDRRLDILSRVITVGEPRPNFGDGQFPTGQEAQGIVER